MKFLFKRIIPVLLILFIGCNSKTKKSPIDFYYWRSNYTVNEAEKKTVDSLNVENVYVRFFDVDKKAGKIAPIGIIQHFEATKLNVNYIPTVFITNRTFLNASKDQVKILAKDVYNFLSETAERGHLKNFNEIQIDCDWTKSTRENYFSFLSELKHISGKKLSATLRLHQVKFKEKEGVPPLDKMVLMCYATENPTDQSENNSILDVKIAKDYLNNLNDYPIQLDVALPIYSWAILTNHVGKIKLINSFSEQDLIGKPVKKVREGFYEVEDDFFVHNFYVSKGFTIKVETISPELLVETKSFLDTKLKYDYRLIYYHLDSKFLKTIPTQL
ncbi:hypothetical protein AS589_00940 [Empedobacter brevis]|uniref:hypothetical protein n=1 Tax=Empedobacter brevis TaxID=247 RepID=UPI0013201A4A|nr:hypothetical protein [Empedobacter brevis]QHC83459.1 hypothetical protein AS589_00940 [Empedobacter brevis]